MIVDEGIARAAYPLDEGIINFGSALEEQDFEYAMRVLEPLPHTPETVVQWERLAAQALETNQVGPWLVLCSATCASVCLCIVCCALWERLAAEALETNQASWLGISVQCGTADAGLP